MNNTYKDCICILSVKPQEIWINFLKQMYIKYHNKYDIFIIVDDNSIKYNSTPEVKIIQIDDNIVKLSSFVNSCKTMIKKTPITWDKSLYYFCKNNNYENYWFIEEDVFIPSIDTINNFYKNHNLNNVDVIVKNYEYFNIKKTDWHWKDIYKNNNTNNDTYFNLPWYRGYSQIIRLSNKMLNLITKFVKDNNRLLFIEYFFLTLAFNNNLNVKQIPELGILDWRKDFFYININGILYLKNKMFKNKNKVYHPIKNLEDQLKLRIMFENNINKIIIVTPAGRSRYLKLLLKQLKKQKNDFDEWHLWENTQNKEDEIYIKNLVKKYDWIKCITRKFPKNIKKGTSYGISLFWNYVNDKNTVYIRFDDDIIYIEENFIKKIVKFRLDNPKYSIVYGNIVNNNIIDHIHQKIGAFSGVTTLFPNLDKSFKLNTNINYNCMGNSWKSKILPIFIHNKFIKDIENNNLEKWKFDKWELNNFERVSINCLCWRGGDMDNFNFIDEKNNDEERLISCVYPKVKNKPNVIFGGALVSHGAFFTQRTKELESLIQQYDKFN